MPFIGIYCEGNGCSLMSFNRDPSGFYSWYDVCTDCDSQLTLYISAWIVVFVAAMVYSVSLILRLWLVCTLAKGYPKNTVAFCLPIFSFFAFVAVVIAVLAFPLALPASKSADVDQCNRFLALTEENSGKSSPCNSFNGGYSWSNAANEGVIFWSGSVGYVCLIVCSVFAPILLLVDAFFLRKIRMGELSNSNETQYNALSTDDFSHGEQDYPMDSFNSSSAFSTPGYYNE